MSNEPNLLLKKCTCCLKEKRIDEFHKKGKIRHAQCNRCIQKKKKLYRKQKKMELQRRFHAIGSDAKFKRKVIGSLSDDKIEELSQLIVFWLKTLEEKS